MIACVNAKINLGLFIVRKREDGFHELETLFYPVGVYSGTPENPESFGDVLEICPKDDDSRDDFVFMGEALDCELEKNLVFKAVKAFNKELEKRGIKPKGISVRLLKLLPQGAGLGGGSADASFTLKLLNDHIYSCPFSNKELLDLAASIGADCPFFLENRPIYAEGIGEKMVPSDLSLDGYWAVIVKPDIFVSTKEAFAGVYPHPSSVSIADIIRLPVSNWGKAGLKNDFEASLFEKYPILAELKATHYDFGAEYASMSGSGSSVYGLYPSRELARSSYNRFLKAADQKLKIYLVKL